MDQAEANKPLVVLQMNPGHERQPTNDPVSITLARRPHLIYNNGCVTLCSSYDRWTRIILATTPLLPVNGALVVVFFLIVMNFLDFIELRTFS